MTCPICDNKPPNCDCTERERWQHEEIERLTAEVERHRMTEEEWAVTVEAYDVTYGDSRSPAGQPLRDYLARTAPEAK